MRLFRTALLATALCFSGVSPAAAEPTPIDETVAMPEAAAPSPSIRMGGPCAYETSVIDATVAELNGRYVLMSPVEGGSFNLDTALFPESPEPGQVVQVSRRKITKGTCQPLMYRLVSPKADTPPAN